MTLCISFNRRNAGIYVGAGLLASVFSSQALAEDFDFPASSYYCQKLDGSPSGDRQCSASYESYPGDACGVYDGADEQDPNLDRVIAETGSQCTSEQLDTAKAKTLEKRADLMSYVSIGNDETVNDPVRNTSLRPASATYWPAMTYFANECAIQKCGGHDDSAQSRPKQSFPSQSKPAAPQCEYENDGQCDAPGLCPAGTDVNDCRPKQAPTYTPPPQPQTPYTEIEVCNNHPHDVSVALGAILRPGDQYRTFRGWFNVSAYSCESIAHVMKGYVYFHAEDGYGHKWGNYKNFCVKRTAFRYLRDGTGQCSERTAKFDESFIQSNKYTYNLNNY